METLLSLARVITRTLIKAVLSLIISGFGFRAFQCNFGRLSPFPIASIGEAVVTLRLVEVKCAKSDPEDLDNLADLTTKAVGRATSGRLTGRPAGYEPLAHAQDLEEAHVEG